MNRRLQKIKGGFLTIELLIAVAFFVLTMTGVFLLSSEGQTMGLDVDLGGGGIGNAYSALESAAEGSAEPVGYAALSADSDTSGVYTLTQDVKYTAAPCIKALFETAAWESEQNRSLSAGFATFVASIEEARKLGGGCDPIPAGEWDNPDSLDSVDIGGAPSTGVAVRSIGGERVAMLTANPSAASQFDFYTYDATDADDVNLRASLNIGAGLNGIAAGKEHAYVLEDDNSNQLKVIDVSNPDAPTLVAQISLPNIAYTCSPASAPCMSGRSIAYYDDKVFIGTGYLAFGAPGQNHELHIFDVSNPAAPSFEGSVNVNHNVNDIVVDGDYAYLATSDDSGELTVVDVSDPSDPSVFARYNAIWSAKDGTRIEKQGTIVYLGREKASSGDYDFLSLDVSTPSAPTLLGQRRLSMNGASAAVTGLAVHGPYAFIGTSDTNDEFRVFNVSNPANLVPYGCPPYNYSVKVRDLVYADGYVFAVNESNDALRIIYDDPGSTCN